MKIKTIYQNTPIAALVKEGVIDRNIARSCEAATPRLVTAGDIRRYWLEHGSFTEIPGCRRPGRISRALTNLANITIDEDEPLRTPERPLTETAAFPFLTDGERAEALSFKRRNGHLPMFFILARYLARPDADRNETIYGLWTGLLGTQPLSLAEIGAQYELTSERVRQLIQDFTLDSSISSSRLWNGYADYSTYFVNENSEAYRNTVALECPRLTFRGFASVLRRVHNFDLVDNAFLARRGWAPEIEAWTRRLTQLRDMPRSFASRLSIDGLSMGGKLDSRLKLIVINQIVPLLGLEIIEDNIILPANI